MPKELIKGYSANKRYHDAAVFAQSFISIISPSTDGFVPTAPPTVPSGILPPQLPKR